MGKTSDIQKTAMTRMVQPHQRAFLLASSPRSGTGSRRTGAGGGRGFKGGQECECERKEEGNEEAGEEGGQRDYKEDGVFYLKLQSRVSRTPEGLVYGLTLRSNMVINLLNYTHS